MPDIQAISRSRTILRRARNLLLHGDYIPTEYYVLDDKKIVYVSIPKVACTSLKTALFQDCSHDSTDADIYMRIHRQAAAYCRNRLSRRHQAYFKFAFVRNPLDRLVSCYEDKVRKPIQHNGRYYFSSRYNHILVRRITGSSFNADMSFDEFVRIVCRLPDRFSDGHFKSQYSILYKRGKSTVDFIGMFENLASDWEVIAHRNGLPLLEQKNLSDRNNWQSYFENAETYDIAADRYRHDIEAFGYANSL